MNLGLLHYSMCGIIFVINVYATNARVVGRVSSGGSTALQPDDADIKNKERPMIPLLPQPNLSTRRSDPSPVNDVIHGSRHAVTVTRGEYLKKDWCKTQQLRQVVREEGCLRAVVLNRFCYGQCNSFYIPRSQKRDVEGAAFTSCGFCKPRSSAWVPVTLKCPNSVPKFKRKRILMIKTCKCMAQNIDSKLLN